MPHLWIVYDDRANPVTGTDDAMVWLCADSEREALNWTEPGHVWCYDVDADGKTLINEMYVGPTRPKGRRRRYRHDARRR